MTRPAGAVGLARAETGETIEAMTVSDQLRSEGADPMLLALFEQEARSELVEEFDGKILAIGRYLVSQGVGDYWPAVFALTFPHASHVAGAAMRYVDTGGLD
jgi:hypothetical protein